MRLDAMGLGNVLVNDVTSSDAPKLSEVLQGYKQMRDSNGRYWQGLSISITG